MTGGRPAGEPGAFEREWRRRFERFAQGATSEHQISGWSEAGLRRRIRAFDELMTSVAVEAGSPVLDLGSGAGTYVRLLGSQGHRPVGVDYSIPSLKRSIEADRDGVGRYLCGDAYALPFRDRAFRMVVMIGIFQALGEPPRALAEARRVLRPGGHIVLEILNAQEVIIGARALMDRAHRRPPGVRAYRRAAMNGWLRKAGFTPLRSVPIFLPPRGLPAVERWLDQPAIRFVLRTVPICAILGAPAFLVLARRDDAPAI